MTVILKGVSRTVVAAVLAVIIIVAVVGGVLYYYYGRAPPTTTPTTPAQLKPQIHTQVLYIIANDEMTRIQMYKAGVADIAVVTPARWRDVNMSPVDGHYIWMFIDSSRPRLTIQHLILNTMREPFNIAEVRQALAYAVPYDAILSQVFGGMYMRLYTIVPKGMFGYTEYNIIKYEFNMTKAREIIDKLKQERGFDPSKYTIVVIYNTGNTARAQIAALLQNYWSQLGFKVLVETYSWPEYLRKVDHFEFDVAILGWIPDYLDPDNYLMPFVWGGAEFKDLKYYKGASPTDVSKYLASIDRVIDTEKYIVVVGPAGSGATYTGPTNKPLLVVSYVLDEEKTEENWADPISMVTIGAPGWKDIAVSALVKLSRIVLDPEAREAIINAAVIVFNNECPMILLGQQMTAVNYGSWVKNMYYPLTMAARYDLVWETPDAPVRDTGILGIKNDPQTMVIATIGWPDTFDPAKSYESFGWEIFTQIYSTLVTYYYENTEPEPNLAVAWAFSSDATELYFVIRGNVVAYDPWNDKTYPINATDVLFSIWRVARLNLPGSAVWMITDFIDVNASQVLTEDEFKAILSQGLVTVYHGKEYEVKSWDDLMRVFNYSGPTAGVVKFKLKFPYPPILHIFTTGVTSIISARYALGDKYGQAMADSNYGKNPAAWAKYVIEGEDDETYRKLKDYPISTGPYYVADYREDSYILLKLNKYYWNATIWYELYGYRP